jgi:hypothetical protein
MSSPNFDAEYKLVTLFLVFLLFVLFSILLMTGVIIVVTAMHRCG